MYSLLEGKLEKFELDWSIVWLLRKWRKGEDDKFGNLAPFSLGKRFTLVTQ